jgi:hypothetical protein
VGGDQAAVIFEPERARPIDRQLQEQSVVVRVVPVADLGVKAPRADPEVVPPPLDLHALDVDIGGERVLVDLEAVLSGEEEAAELGVDQEVERAQREAGVLAVRLGQGHRERGLPEQVEDEAGRPLGDHHGVHRRLGKIGHVT